MDASNPVVLKMENAAMVTDPGRTFAPSSQPGVFERGMTHVRQFICGLHGHDALLHFEHGRMSLQCSSCGYETPGWDLKPAATQTERVPQGSRAVRVPLVSDRRVA
jgi:hypothetical protein